LLLLAAGDEVTVNRALDRVRRYIAKQLNLADPKAHGLLWVTDFPMFEWNQEEQRHEALHHPFTAPNQQQAEQNGGDLRHATALAYDLVYNGVEIGGQSDMPHFWFEKVYVTIYMAFAGFCLTCIPQAHHEAY